MYREEEKMVILLSEIKEACEKNNARYFVIGQELLSAVRNKRLYEGEADICMLYGDYLKIRDDLEAAGNRVIESIQNNIKMPGMYFRYVDRESLYYVQKYHRVRTAHGVAVNIHILRKKDDVSKDLCEREKNMEAAIGGKGKKVIFPGMFTKKMEKLLAEAALTDLSEKSMINIPGEKTMSFPASFWKKQSVIRIGGTDFKTVSKPEQYLEQRYGEDYMTSNLNNLRMNYQVIADPDIGYEGLVGKMESFLDQNPEYRGAHERFTSFYNDTYAELSRITNEKNDIMLFIGDRFTLWKKYVPVKEEIRSLLESGRHDEAFLILKDYFDLFKKYLKKGKVMYFDEDCWQIASRLWTECGYGELVEEAEALMEITSPVELPEDRLKEVFKDQRPIETVKIRNS